jgi:hypothetical protein
VQHAGTDGENTEGTMRLIYDFYSMEVNILFLCEKILTNFKDLKRQA